MLCWILTKLGYHRYSMECFICSWGQRLHTKVKGHLRSNSTRRFSNHESRLLSRAHTFAIIVIVDLKIHQRMWIHWPFFPKTWTKGHWPLHDLWPHVCWSHMFDSTQGSLCPSPWQYINVCGYSDQFCKLPHTYTYYIHTSYILHTTYILRTEWVIT